MRKFTYTVELEKAGAKPGDAIDQKTLFEVTMNQGLGALNPNGLDHKTRRLYGRIIDKVIEAPEGTVELEETEFDLVVEVFTSDKARYQPNQTRLINLYVRAIEGATKL